MILGEDKEKEKNPADSVSSEKQKQDNDEALGLSLKIWLELSGNSHWARRTRKDDETPRKGKLELIKPDGA